MNIVKSIYSYPLQANILEQQSNSLLFSGRFYFYSYAREALYEILKIVCKKGESVLVPAFICRDLLGAINSLELNIIFYQVNSDLSPVLTFEELPVAKVIIGVNYFGFPCQKNYFINYSKKNSSFFIEDNAHGFLSRDEDGLLLGTRGDFGLFSFRKTFPSINLSALWIRDGLDLLINSKKVELEKQHGLKLFLQRLTPFLPFFFWPTTLYFMRLVKMLLTGKAYPASSLQAETEAPVINSFHSDVNDLFKLSFSAEIERRRKLFNFIKLKFPEISPIFKVLAEGVVPYTYPFRIPEAKQEEIAKKFRKAGLEIIPWPELPSKVMESPHNDYSNVFMVRFRW